MIERELILLQSLLDCAIKVADRESIKALEYHPVGFADSIANLENPCSLGDVIYSIKEFVDSEIKSVQEENNHE